MDHIPLFNGYRIVLAPRWADLGPAPQIALLALVCLVPLGLVFWLYRYEMRLVTPRTARTLLCLRGIALVLLLSLVCLQPTYARETAEDLPSKVIVAVDLSDSLEVPDPQREPLEKLKFARALKLTDGLCSREQLDDWIRLHESKKPADLLRAEDLVGPDEFTGDQARRRKEGTERLNAYKSVLERIDKLTRSQTAKHLLSPDGMRFVARLKERYKDNVELIGFTGATVEVPADNVNDLFSRLPAKVPAQGANEKAPTLTSLRRDATDLELPLLHALERSAQKRGKIAGVVLLTDGQHRGEGKPPDHAEKLREQGISLYPIALGGEKAPPDVAVVAVLPPPSIYRDDEAPFTVRFRANGLKAQDLKVLVHRPGEEEKPLDQRTIKHDGSDRIYNEKFQIRFDRDGTQPVQVTILPQGVEVKDVNKANDKQMVLVNVADDTSKVLLIDGEGRWEFHYIWQALLRTQSMKVKSVVFQQPRLGQIPQSELEKLNHPLSSLPPAPKPELDPLFDYDCIILGDVAPELLKAEDRKRLEKFVADRGGTLVVLAGKKAMPQAYLNPDQKPAPMPNPGGKPDDDKDPLIKLLPIDETRIVAREKAGFPVALTEEGKQSDFLRLVDPKNLLDPDSQHPMVGSFEAWLRERGQKPDEAQAQLFLQEEVHGWKTQPRHYWGVVGKAKPGATVLASVPPEQEKKEVTPEERRQQEQDNALFVRHNYGFGRVFFVGVDSTWRYRYRIGDLYHHRFWSQTIRWAASDRPLAAGNRFVRFGTAQPMYRSEDLVKVTVRLRDEVEKLPEDLKAQARVLRKDDDRETEVALIDLSARPFQPRLLDGRVRDLPPGKYEVELKIPKLEEKLQPTPDAEGKPMPMRARFEVSPGENGELVNLSRNLTLLKELAQKNGTNRVYTPETSGELIEKLTTPEMKKTETADTRLYSWWPTLLIILTFLTAEWVLRKWAGLP